MPIIVKTCLEQNVLYAKWQGRITVAEFVDVFIAYTEGPHYSPGRPELIDTSSMLDIDVGFNEMRSLLRNVNSQSQQRKVKTKTVVFCPNDYIFGLGHMYKRLAELGDGIKVELYEEETSALAAIGLPFSTIKQFITTENFV